MNGIFRIIIFAVMLTLSGCKYLGIKSLVTPGSVAVNDSAAMAFLRGAPSTRRLGEGLAVRDPAADGRGIALVVSGGGMRAAAFTLGVLDGLQDVGGGYNALADVDFISSNSGGGWAAARYLTEARENPAVRLSDPKTHDAIAASFARAASGTVPCWEKRVATEILPKATFATLYAPDGRAPLPAIYFNASILPAQAPFVFTDDYLNYYRVGAIHTCLDRAEPTSARIADLPIATAATISSTVPGFYWAFAETRLCRDGPTIGSLCATDQKGGPRDYISLADGGLYDNIGYKTAFELLRANGWARHSDNDLAIVVNSNTDTVDQTVARANRTSSFAGKLLFSTTFPNQNATFQRLHAPLFHAVGVNRVVLLDYFAASGFRMSDAAKLTGLERLAEYASKQVACFASDGFHAGGGKMAPTPPPLEVSLKRLEDLGGDCLKENFYRAGPLGKTTYAYDPILFEVQWQLGRLVVRMNAAALSRDAPPGTPGDVELAAAGPV